MISPIVYGPLVLVLLVMHALTFKLMLKRIRDLECALVARNALLGEDQHVVTNTNGGTLTLHAGDSVTFQFKVAPKTFQVISSKLTQITYTSRS
jgi:hypothetical protein